MRHRPRGRRASIGALEFVELLDPITEQSPADTDVQPVDQPTPDLQASRFDPTGMDDDRLPMHLKRARRHG